MINVTTYDAVGRLLAARTVDAEGDIATSGVNYVLGWYDQLTKYVSGGVVVDRPPNPTTLYGTTLSNVPSPATIRVDGLYEYAITGPTVEMAMPIPGIYQLIVMSFPYAPAFFTMVSP